MYNPFVDYLNSLHNATAGNANALAESQALQPFYERIQVRRRVGDHIAGLLRDRTCCIILTGHAGDGKTGLLYQILVELGVIRPKSELQQTGRAVIPGSTKHLLYVKDMSELPSGEQEELLLAALRAPKSGHSSVLISNTGPLLNTFKRLLTESRRLSDDFVAFQSRLLKAMDDTRETDVSVGEYSFTLVNMARIDNAGMAGLILNRITAEDLWSECASCSARETCPVLNNVETVRANFERTTNFIETYLGWLQEHDDRLTLRQIIAQLAFALTSGLSCAEVHDLPASQSSLFKYHFANGFWGFRGLAEARFATQIRGIRAIRAWELDETATPADYKIFVQKDLSMFEERTRGLVEAVLNGRAFTQSVQVADPAVRRSVRRFLLLFGSRQAPDEYEKLLESLFSPVLPVYERVKRGRAELSDHRLLQRWVARGLYRSIVGVPRPDDGPFKDKIHVTIRTNRSGITGVQLLLGEINDSQIEIEARPIGSYADSIDNRQLYMLVMKLRNSEDVHTLSLPLLDYLYRLGEGAISTRLNPYLSHGLDRIKASLVRYAGESTDEVRLLILTPEGPQTLSLLMESGSLVVT